MAKNENEKINIKGLFFPDDIRTRPTMYMGSLDDATQCVKEIVSNCLDEALHPSSKCDTAVWKELGKQKYEIKNKKYETKGHLIADNGRGLPLALVKNEKEELVTMARYSLESKHTSSKFNNTVASIGCFVGETKVKVNDSSKDLRTLVEKPCDDDKVYCSDGSMNDIKRGQLTMYVKKLIEITLSNNKVERCTLSHPIMLSNGDYRQAKNLKTGDKVFTIDNSELYISSVNEITLDKEVPVYDIEVDNELHNFVLDSGLVIKNCNGVGSSSVNALSYSYEVFVRLGKTAREDEAPDYIQSQLNKKNKKGIYHIKYSFGLLQTEEILNNDCKEMEEFNNILGDWSTIIIFYPDTSIYESAEAYYENESRYTKYLIDRLGKDFKLIINGKPFEFNYQPYKYKIEGKVPTTMEETKSYLEYIISMEFSEDFDEVITGSVNGLQVDSRYHTNLFKDVFKKVFYKQFGNCHGKERLGMKIDVIMLCPEPQFDSQTKTRLVNFPYVDYDVLFSSISKQLVNLIKLNSEEFTQHYARILSYLDSINNLSSLQKLEAHAPQSDNGKVYRARLSQTNVKDCISQNPDERELFIVEGGSAGSSVVQARNKKTQAVLPLRGKVLNAAYMSSEKMIENKEISDLITILGAGVDDNFNPDNLRFHKVIIACFDKDTKVPLAEGTVKTLKQLHDELGEGGEVEVFTRNKNGELDTEIATIHKTKIVDRMIEVEYTNGGKSRCTEDHLFPTTDGRWIEAKELKEGMSISSMKLYKNNDYYQFSISENVGINHKKGLNHKLLHRHLVELSENIDGKIVHHKNHIKHDNRKSNLMSMNRFEHISYHSKEYRSRPETKKLYKKKFEEGVYDKFIQVGYERSQTEEHKIKCREQITRYNKSQAKKDRNSYLWRETNTYQKCIDNMIKYNKDPIRKRIRFQNKYMRETMRDAISKYPNNNTFTVDEIKEIISQGKAVWFNQPNDYENVLQRLCNEEEFSNYKWITHNHKIKFIRYIDTPNEQTYCLNVPNNSCFYVSDGLSDTMEGTYVLTHNCDADTDGYNIASILLGIFAQHLSYLIKNGYLYLAVTPLFEQDGVPIYLHEKDKLNRKKPFQRFKGLGEATVAQMKRYLTNPETRTLIQVTSENYEKIAYYSASTEGRRELMVDSGLVSLNDEWDWKDIKETKIDVIDED